VIVLGPVALKIARNQEGRACNRYEANLYRTTTTTRRRAMLCPVLWVSPGGFLLITRSAVPLSEMMSLEEYLNAAEEWDPCPARMVAPSNPRHPTGGGTRAGVWR